MVTQKNWTFLFLSMTQRIKLLFFLNMTQRIEPFFETNDSKNWTFFSYDSKNWTSFFSMPFLFSMTQRFFSVWLKDLNFWVFFFFEKTTQIIELFSKIRHKELKFFFFFSLWLKDFLSIWLKELNFFSMTQRIEPFFFFFYMTQKRAFKKKTKNLTFWWLTDLNHLFLEYDYKNWPFFFWRLKVFLFKRYDAKNWSFFDVYFSRHAKQ